MPLSLDGNTGSCGISSDKRGSRLYRDIKSGFDAVGAEDDDDEETCGDGNCRWYGESRGAFYQPFPFNRDTTGGSVFRERILLVVISTEPVLERSYAIELGGRLGNMVCMT